ncbi:MULTISPECIES: phosphoenolpyruvate--protein phosphotransferase [Methylosinus]|uniref:phosphoenolpyruvate--protein phosphotransferase n=1 Tax=Methylosinus trichosporium (strain ATCC 35070 / NCIMB 11131 / UNIQEM 75 / OB3b) TaxID=595536 RepID=A0A2D2CVB7_METT3|nr:MULTISPECIES: phosphoenolpyruvate--protein phosphotransferase [Methylosinus]ATQ66634.1 phosphoenolpyruvate--protein phosphotransferase [Methylosinus trichosporium OB3b]OBS51716.1 phosphoenolpyruvate--protein phosphotransferase [Methylosinus sp. 3S-1]
MRSALGGPRLLLRRLREVMAEPVSAQARLDKIVVLIASNMVAEVCSVYVQHADQTLELYATEGLNREAVHLTTMRTSEGLVGLIARNAEPLALSEAQEHPSFAYRPETGEEVYHSFLGVPILRGGNTLGVLVVQNKVRRVYSDEEIEALQTTAMLVAEMIASGELRSIAKAPENFALDRPLVLKGAPMCEGVGLGYVVLHEPRVVIKQLIAEDVAAEARRLDAAIEAMRISIDELVAHGDRMGAGEHREVLEAVRIFANDRGWVRRLHEAVLSGLTAEAAVERVQNDARAKLQRQTDPYLRDRLHDLDDLANRLLHQLTGQSYVSDRELIPENAIVVARTMGPAALLDYDSKRLRGLVLEEGGPASHVGIVARALGIATVGLAPNVSDLVEAGDAIIVDGVTGDVHIRPPPDVQTAYGEKARLRARRMEQYAKLRDVPAVTKDGAGIALHMNAGLIVDVPHLHETGASSIGLFRTELQFMVAPRFPRMNEQYLLYKAVLDSAPERPVTFRTLDIGSDKILPYMATIEEENPALGWRAIRIGLDRPGLLRMQLRAMLKAAAGRDLRIMFPMIANVAEFDAAKGIALRELAHLERHGHATPSDLRLGAMVEVPSLLWELDTLAAHADFLSVGSNDLVQYMYAADRDNTRVAKRYDPLSTPVLRALERIADAGRRAGKTVTLCGEMGGRPLEALALLAIGYRSLSMSPSSIGPVKAMILATNLDEAQVFVAALLAEEDGAPSLREKMREFALSREIPV